MANASIWQDDPRVPIPESQTRSYESLILAVRTVTGSNARDYMPQLRSAIREIEPYATIGNVSTLAERYTSKRREAAETNLAAFGVGAVALLLASLGLYAIIAFAVAQRTREIGVRMAVGATSRDVVRHFFRGGLVVTAIGLAIGLPLTVAGIRIVQASVIGFTFRQLAPIFMVVPVLIGVAAMASWLPARRAGRVDPLVALRSE
jgi:cell division protein FtsX